MLGFSTITQIASESFLFWIGYLLVMAAFKRRNAGTLTGGLLYAAFVLVAVVALFDVFYNFTVGSLVFLSWPKNLTSTPTSWTFTARCKYWLTANDGGWRTQLAYGICHYLLDPFAPDGKHCE